MKLPTYQASCATPTSAREVLDVILATLEADPSAGPALAQRVDTVLVDGKPLSSARFMATLDSASPQWDPDEDPEATRGFVESAERLAALLPSLDVRPFVLGFDQMPGAGLTPPPRRAPPKYGEHIVASVIAPPTLGGALLGRALTPSALRAAAEKSAAAAQEPAATPAPARRMQR